MAGNHVRDRQVSGVLEQPSKLWLWSEAHGSICVQEGEPNLIRGSGSNPDPLITTESCATLTHHRWRDGPPSPAPRRAVRGSRGVNLFVASACPARRRFSVYFLVYETQKEDGACALHLASSASCWNRSGGVSSTRSSRVTLAMPTSNRFQAGTICWRWSTPSSPRRSACGGWKRVGTPTVSIITIWAVVRWSARPCPMPTGGGPLGSSPRLSAWWPANWIGRPGGTARQWLS